VRDEGLVAHALLDALAADGCTVTFDAAQSLMGYAKPEAIRRLLSDARQGADDARIARVHQDFVARMLDTYRHDPRVAPMQGAERVFAAVRRAGLRVALDTAFSREIADAIVARFQWRERGLIDALIAADEVSAGRPAPHMIHALMAQFGVTDAHAVIKVGDTEADIHEGRNSGCGLVVAVTTGAYTRSALAAYAPDHLIDRLDDLLPLLPAAAA
jgi:phosphonatase-like hydrolase